jgi:hypothetical protein
LDRTGQEDRVLLDPNSSPIIVLEEPELGLHPDVLPALRDLMIRADEGLFDRELDLRIGVELVHQVRKP